MKQRYRQTQKERNKNVIYRETDRVTDRQREKERDKKGGVGKRMRKEWNGESKF